MKSVSPAHYASQMEHDLNDRARHLLEALVGEYIRAGRPVGSRTLAKHGGLNLSPATVRNVLSDLEDYGYIAAPHTSAGRVPTVQGYRFFVDTLLTHGQLRVHDNQQIESALANLQGTQELVAAASTLLSAMTHFVGVVSVPKREQFGFRFIDFVKLDECQVLAILVFTDNEVQNRLIETSRDYSPAELERAANYLNQEFAGTTISETRERLLRDIRHVRQHIDKVAGDAVELAGSVLGDFDPEDLIVSGQTNLLGSEDFPDIDRLRSLFDTLTEKRRLLSLLEECAEAEGVRLFIGEESGHEAFDDCSVVTAPYSVDDNVVGVLGVIGPTRMAYDRIISVVDSTAKLLSSALNQAS